MASQGPNAGGTFTTAIDGVISWANVDASHLGSDNGTYANTGGNFGDAYRDQTIQLLNSGSLIGTNQAINTALGTTFAYRTYGGASSLWGATLSASIVNGSTFGVRIRMQTFSNNTDKLDVTNLGFSVTAGATIDGVMVEIKWKYDGTAGQAWVDFVRVTVYYTEAATGQPTMRRFSQASGFRPVEIGREGGMIA